MNCLGLDIGSSSIKGAVLDLSRGEVGAVVTRAFPSPIAGLTPGWFEVDPRAVESEVDRVLNSLLGEAPDAASLYCSGQMGGVVLVDASGDPLTNYLSWRDQRTLGPSAGGESYLDKIRNRWGPAILESLGNELPPGSAANLLYWLASNQRLPPDSTIATIGDYVMGRRCGVCPSMHVTQAVGLLDHRASDWHRDALRLLGLSGMRLPQLSRSPEAIGRCTIQGRSLPVRGVYGDQQCALRGAGLRRGELSINVSTGSQVSCRTTSFQPGPFQTRCYFDGDWLNTVTHLPAGRSLNVLVDLLTELAATEGVTLHHVWDSIARKASEVDATTLQVDLAFFAGPLGSAGSVHGITTENFTVGGLFNAAFGAMADNYLRCAAWLDPRQTWDAVVLSGGLTGRIPLLRRMIQDRFPHPLRETSGDDTMSGLLDIARSIEFPGGGSSDSHEAIRGC